MEASTITSANGKPVKLKAEHTLTDKKDKSDKVVPIESTKAIVFFVGGAGDKESYYFSGPYENIKYAQEPLDERANALQKQGKYRSAWLGYNQIRGKKDIQKNVLNIIPYKSCPIYIIGHSLGGWNSGHLTKTMADWGYTITTLVTLDPVGEGTLVWLGSDIAGSAPTPVAEKWINIRATPSKPDDSDKVADFGERWVMSSGPDLNVNMDINHANAFGMFMRPIVGSQSACDIIFESITNKLAKK
ncbi:alpha/beta hydrolase [Pseudomonas chlororaphis]|uniref:alpha/beta hydrolase n=1 Tax=Pseudomonas chlororaphis TaxID=587753 RepID=UPI0014731F77|nr:alpha/beta hydrolase [Pseudomonas chlororaphis]NNB44567.1 alpha/beta hydrolase [Pseudomonas chlororaphis]